MSRPKNPNLQGELEEFKKRDAKRLNREGYPDKSYAERVHREMDMNRALKNRGTPIQKARQGMVPKYDRARYVAENGIDSADRGLSKNEFNRRVGATVTRNLLQQAFREKAKKNKERDEIRKQILRDSFKEDVLINKPGTRTNIVPGDLDLKKSPSKKERSQTARPRNWERWREMGEDKEKIPSGPAIDSDSAYWKMQERRNGRKKKW